MSATLVQTPVQHQGPRSHGVLIGVPADRRLPPGRQADRPEQLIASSPCIGFRWIGSRYRMVSVPRRKAGDEAEPDHAQALAGFGRYAGPGHAHPRQPRGRRQARLRPDQGHRVLRRRPAGARHALRGARPAPGAGADRARREPRPPPPLPAHRRGRGDATGPPRRAATCRRCRPPPPGRKLGPHLSTPDPAAPDTAAPDTAASRYGCPRYGCPRYGRPARRAAAPLVPEGMAVPLRRGVHGAPDLRYR